MNNYYVTAFPGLSSVVSAELAERTRAHVTSSAVMRNAELLFLRAEDPSPLLGLRTVEDVFAHLATVTLSGHEQDLKKLASVPALGVGLSRALQMRAHVKGQSPVRQAFRVVVQAEDVHWRSFRRIDMQAAIESVVRKLHPTWRLVGDDADVEVWLQQVKREVVFGLRLTAAGGRQHGGRAVERAAALRPSVAAALVYLSAPSADDVFMDPMCGTGTILLERAVWGRYQLLLGGDIDAAAVKATLANFGPRHKPRRIEGWDATSLPIDDAAVTKIVCNLPWGRQISDKRSLPKLYADFLKEAVRVLIPGGTMVLLSSEWELLRQCISQYPPIRVQRTVQRVGILGRQADIFVLVRE